MSVRPVSVNTLRLEATLINPRELFRPEKSLGLAVRHRSFSPS